MARAFEGANQAVDWGGIVVHVDTAVIVSVRARGRAREGVAGRVARATLDLMGFCSKETLKNLLLSSS